MNVKREFKNQLELMEEPMCEIAHELFCSPRARSKQISEIFGKRFLRLAEEKLTETELDTVQNFIDNFYNLILEENEI